MGVLGCDVRNYENVVHAAKEMVKEYGQIDVWINNAGTGVYGIFEEIPYEDYRKVIETNLMGYIHGARAVLPYFKRQGFGTLNQ